VIPLYSGLYASLNECLSRLYPGEGSWEPKGYIAYCDADGIFINPEIVKDIQEFLNPMSPYSTKVEMFKIGAVENKIPLDYIMFCWISAKRGLACVP